MPWLKVGMEEDLGIDLFYEDFGVGDPIVLIHGWPLTHRSWEPQIRRFVDAGYRVVAFDRRGFGRSTQSWAGYDYDTFAADLHTLIEVLELVGATIVGSSFGGGDVARYVGRYGTSGVKRIVFASSVLPLSDAITGALNGGIDRAAIADMAAASMKHRIALLNDVLTTQFSVVGELAIDHPTLSYFLQIAAAGSAKGASDSLLGWTTADFCADLSKIDVPTMLIQGDADAFIPFETSGLLTSRVVVDSSVVVIPQAPHAASVTHANQWNEAVLKFIQSTV